MNDFKQQVKLWKQKINQAFPKCKVSVYVLPGDDIMVKIFQGNFPAFKEGVKGDLSGYQPNQFRLDDGRMSAEMVKFWKTVDSIREKVFGNQTNSDQDVQRDYFSNNYTFNYQIGNYDKPYEDKTTKRASNKVIASELIKIAKDLISDEDWKNQFRNLEREINTQKRNLESRAKRNGLNENFGEEAIRVIKDNYFDLTHVAEYSWKRKAINAIENFEDWAENYTLNK